MQQSANAIGQRALDFLGRVQRAQHGDRFDGRQREPWRYVSSDTGESQYLDVQFFTGRSDRLQIRSGEVAESELQRMPPNRFLDFLPMPRKLVADRRPNEVGTVGIESFLNQQIYMAEVDVTQVDRNLFRLACSVAESMNLGSHRCSPSVWMVYGWSAPNFQAFRRMSSERRRQGCDAFGRGRRRRGAHTMRRIDTAASISFDA